MRKRGANGRFKSSGGSLTGGTGDVKPQILTAFVSAPSGLNDYSVARVPVPRIILGSTGAATVMEILRVDWYIAIEDLGELAASYWAFLTTNPARAQDESVTELANFTQDLRDARTFAAALHDRTGTSSTFDMPISIDLTDDNGNGVLIASDNIFAISGEFSNGVATAAVAKILYRLTDVGIIEYVGIVQSQTS